MTTQQPPRPAPDPSESLPVVRLLPRPVRIGIEYEPLLGLTIEYEREGPRWIADVPELPGVMVYGQTRKDAREAALRLAVAVIRDRENSIPPRRGLAMLPDPILYDTFGIDMGAVQTSVLIALGVNPEWYALGYLYSAAKSRGRVEMYEDQMPADAWARRLVLNGMADEMSVWSDRYRGIEAN